MQRTDIRIVRIRLAQLSSQIVEVLRLNSFGAVDDLEYLLPRMLRFCSLLARQILISVFTESCRTDPSFKSRTSIQWRKRGSFLTDAFFVFLGKTSTALWGALHRQRGRTLGAGD